MPEKKKTVHKNETPHPEVINVPSGTPSVSCDGGGGALGHPKVWYSFDGKDEVVCGYCDRLFTKKHG